MNLVDKLLKDDRYCVVLIGTHIKKIPAHEYSYYLQLYGKKNIELIAKNYGEG